MNANNRRVAERALPVERKRDSSRRLEQHEVAQDVE
jgi:hypothetical protein